jgi:hypothetical protein
MYNTQNVITIGDAFTTRKNLVEVALFSLLLLLLLLLLLYDHANLKVETASGSCRSH